MIIASRVQLLKDIEELKRAELSLYLLEEKLSSLLQKIKEIARDVTLTWDELILKDQTAILSLINSMIKEEHKLIFRKNNPKVKLKIPIERETIHGVTIPRLGKISYIKIKDVMVNDIMQSLSTYETINDYNELIKSILIYCEQLIILQKLSNELKKTRRQYMVLKQMILPELKFEINLINDVLDQREMEEQIRLRKFRKLRI